MTTTQKARRTISISVDHVWAGSGWLNADGIIEDCGAQFDPANGDATESVYEAIEATIAAGKDSVKVADVGTITWHIGDGT